MWDSWQPNTTHETCSFVTLIVKKMETVETPMLLAELLLLREIFFFSLSLGYIASLIAGHFFNV
jgi:hypothetical protein